MERHAVPQNIMDVEFKLFGALTIKQFGYLAAGVIASLIIYFTGLPFIIRAPLILFSFIIGLVTALVKINGQPSAVFIANFVKAMFVSQDRVWKKTAVTPDILKEESVANPATAETIVERVKKSGSATTARMPLMGLERKIVTNTNEVDDLEDQRLEQIDKHFQYAIEELNDGSAPAQQIRRDAKPPSFQKQAAPPPSNPPAGNYQQDSLAGSVVNEGRENVVNNENYSATYKPMQSAVNRPLARNEKVVTTQGQPKAEDLEKQIASLQGELNTLKQANKENVTNLLHGVVVDQENIPIPSATITIYDSENKVVKKLNADENGRVLMTSKLADGTYYIDIVANGFKFNRYKVILTGNELPTYKFKARS